MPGGSAWKAYVGKSAWWFAWKTWCWKKCLVNCVKNRFWEKCLGSCVKNWCWKSALGSVWKTNVGKGAWWTAWKTDAGKVPGELLRKPMLEKVPGELRWKLQRKWQKRCRFKETKLQASSWKDDSAGFSWARQWILLYIFHYKFQRNHHMLDHILMKCHYLCSLTYVDKMSHFTRFDAFWQNVAIYALCQAQNFGCQALSTILHPWLMGQLLIKSSQSSLLQIGQHKFWKTILIFSESKLFVELLRGINFQNLNPTLMMRWQQNSGNID